MKKLSILSFGLLFLLSRPAFGSEWRDVAPGDTVTLPADLYYRKEYRIQWWYFTGHLFDGKGREFGYEATFFAVGVQKKKYRSKFGVDTVYLAHLAVTDVQEKRYYHFSTADAGAYGFAGADEKRLHVWVDKDLVEGTPKKMHVRAAAEDVGLDLVLAPAKPAVLNGERGYSRKSEASPLIASRYFSFTDLETEGTVKLGSSVFPVSGKSWFDRELSSRRLSKDEAGWDWFALQLEDGREIMLYEIRKKDGSLGAYSSGTLVSRDGGYRRLSKKDFTVKVLDHYTSGHTGARYPSKWEIIIPSEDMKLDVTPFVRDQEFTAANAMGDSYWEGACGIEGSAWGRAYVEMTGYQKK
jgi:predicted secreted hydrolase